MGDNHWKQPARWCGVNGCSIPQWCGSDATRILVDNDTQIVGTAGAASANAYAGDVTVVGSTGASVTVGGSWQYFTAGSIQTAVLSTVVARANGAAASIGSSVVITARGYWCTCCAWQCVDILERGRGEQNVAELWACRDTRACSLSWASGCSEVAASFSWLLAIALVSSYMSVW